MRAGGRACVPRAGRARLGHTVSVCTGPSRAGVNACVQVCAQVRAPGFSPHPLIVANSRFRSLGLGSGTGLCNASCGRGTRGPGEGPVGHRGLRRPWPWPLPAVLPPALCPEGDLGSAPHRGWPAWDLEPSWSPTAWLTPERPRRPGCLVGALLCFRLITQLCDGAQRSYHLPRRPVSPTEGVCCHRCHACQCHHLPALQGA